MRKLAREVYIDDKIYRYVRDLCDKARNHPLIRLGISPRGALALCAMAQSWAYMQDRDYVIPQDVIDVFPDVAVHRLMLSSKAHVQNETAQTLIRQILDQVSKPDVTR